MRKFVRKFTLYFLLPAAFLYVAFVAGFLQEWNPNDLPDAAREAGISMPLEDPWISVSIQRMTLSLMNGETLIKRYNIGYGNGPVGAKLNRKKSTPLGEYRIVKKEKRKNLRTRGSRWLQLNFPNEEDADIAWEQDLITQQQYDAILRANDLGEIPPIPKAFGTPLGIQGNFFFFFERRFTDGSIGLSNGDINEIYRYVSVGTRVVIKDR